MSEKFYCHFCGKENADVKHLVAGPGCNICNECVDLCVEVIKNHEKEKAMANVFEGKPDERQSEDPNMTVSRFRKRYRALTDEEVALHDQIKTKAEELEALFNQLNPGRYRSLAFTDLELAIMWAIKELTL